MPANRAGRRNSREFAVSQPIALGTVLGGRYQVTASLLTSADDDHVLQGEDQILRRRVSILVPGDHHEQLMVANARSLASGSGSDRFQILDLGQTQDTTYVVTSYAPAADLLDTLLVAENELEDESLSDDIFGDSRTAPASPYVYEEPDPTQPHQAVPAAGTGANASSDAAGPRDDAQAARKPAVTKWSDDEYEAYENAPAAPSVRNKLGRARKVDPESTRSTLFDRAAAGGSGAAVGASAAAAGKIDPTYDGDNRYESFEANEGKPERLTGYPVIEDETPGQGHSGAATPAGAAATDEAIERGEEPVDEYSDEYTDDHKGHRDDHRKDGSARSGGGSAAAGAGAVGAAGAAGAVGAAGAAGGSGAGHGAEATADPESPGKKRNGPLRALLLLLLILVLLAAVVFGFRALGSLTGQFGGDDSDPAPQGEQTTSAPQESEPADDQVEPQAQDVTRVTSDRNFMADTDATLSQAIDDNPSTYWLSYGFSNAAFGNLIDYVGLAVELEEPAPLSEITIDQSSGTGGNFTVYVSDTPSMDGAQQVGTGSFTGPQITVPLDQAAQDGEHQYVLVVWDQLPQLTNPIGGYQYGLRIGEVTVQ
ncbi:hypothetical protein [Kocuria carniphila]|uniref:hypothetical protein n=1 Tax=Kocuria carniphila TaxID=262208 RepID=UPI0028E669EE|nr:hypothetical protein [Kocuria carniphila]